MYHLSISNTVALKFNQKKHTSAEWWWGSPEDPTGFAFVFQFVDCLHNYPQSLCIILLDVLSGARILLSQALKRKIMKNIGVNGEFSLAGQWVTYQEMAESLRKEKPDIQDAELDKHWADPDFAMTQAAHASQVRQMAQGRGPTFVSRNNVICECRSIRCKCTQAHAFGALSIVFQSGPIIYNENGLEDRCP